MGYSPMHILYAGGVDDLNDVRYMQWFWRSRPSSSRGNHGRESMCSER